MWYNIYVEDYIYGWIPYKGKNKADTIRANTISESTKSKYDK